MSDPSCNRECNVAKPRRTYRRVTKASDMFSFGLVCIYVLGGGELLLLNDYQELVKNGICPEQEILIRHFSYFGPVTEWLLQQVNSEDWCNALKGASQIAEETVKEQPGLRFECGERSLTKHDIWNDTHGPNG
ncbi:hypothetical protein B0T14DRAFT_579000 [Immersiella caudata]|uniref:Uncharacterized protein n=1 Tax=Immersiella caudata TaxID=314043 RepID=A0AA39X4D9_9PEZI|nr:hypothetical protein B0T14DRAFT_579000 [Immersiella caudata]